MSRLLLLAALAGCATEPAPEAPRAPADVGVQTEDVDATADGLPGRARQRMDVDQLAASIERVTGVAWTEKSGTAEVELFDALSSTLGKPDYLDKTAEDLSPSLLFQKFLDDAAATTCTRAVADDLAGRSSVLVVGVSPDATFDTDPDGVRAALSRAVLRFHGRVVAADDPQLEPWVWLFRSTTHVTGGDVARAWRTVCVGLITHPDFYSY